MQAAGTEHPVHAALVRCAGSCTPCWVRDGLEGEAAGRDDRTGGGTQERVDPHGVCSARGSVALKPWVFSQSMT